MSTSEMPWRQLKLSEEQFNFCENEQLLKRVLIHDDRVRWHAKDPAILEATPIGLEWCAEIFAGAANRSLDDEIKEEVFASLYRACISALKDMSEEEFYAEGDPEDT